AGAPLRRRGDLVVEGRGPEKLAVGRGEDTLRGDTRHLEHARRIRDRAREGRANGLPPGIGDGEGGAQGAHALFATSAVGLARGEREAAVRVVEAIDGVVEEEDAALVGARELYEEIARAHHGRAHEVLPPR